MSGHPVQILQRSILIWNRNLEPSRAQTLYVRKGKPIAANLYLKNVYETHEKRSHSRPKPALVFNRKSADQVLARQGKAILNWFATDCWSKKTWSAEPWNLHQFPDNFCISMIAGLPSFVIQCTVSTWWTCLEVKYEASNGPYGSTLQLRISKSPKKNLAANPHVRRPDEWPRSAGRVAACWPWKLTSNTWSLSKCWESRQLRIQYRICLLSTMWTDMECSWIPVNFAAAGG